jgi:hypothetical protein
MKDWIRAADAAAAAAGCKSSLFALNPKFVFSSSKM